MRKEKRIVSIDYGLVRIGMAISDPSQKIAFPLETVLAKKKLDQTVDMIVQTLAAIATNYRCQIETLVVGMPFLLSGKIGHLADEVLLFIEKVQEKVDIPIQTWDERLTSVQADRLLKEEGNLSRKKRSQKVDAVAALLILQNYLDRKSTL